MRKTRTRRLLKQSLAIFVTVGALWLIWLTADPSGLAEHLQAFTDRADFSLAVIEAELGSIRDPEFSFLDRLVLAQSPLLSLPLPAETLSPPPTVETEAPDNNGETDVEPTPPPVTTSAPDSIIPKTMVAGTSSRYVSEGNLSIYNHTGYKLDIGTLLAAAPELTAGGDGPQVLIYHSHATEAYTMDGSDIYEESDAYRTLDIDHNVVRVGREMTQILESAGIEVIHDTTLYDYPSYSAAYTRSAEGVAQLLKKYPSIKLVIDVHRDALAAEDGTLYKTVTGTVEHCAQVMMVMGTDAAGQKHPNWRVNLALSLGIQNALTEKWATFARPIVLRTSRFNQQLSTGSILLEVGTHGNTLQEAITAGRLFARTIAELMT